MKCKSRISEICVFVVSGDRGIFYRVKRKKKKKKGETAIRKREE